MAVRVSIPDDSGVDTPVPGLRVVALPYDRDSVLASLAAEARLPRPETGEMDSLYALFRDPFVRYAGLAARVERLEAAGAADSVAELRPGLDAARRELDRVRPVLVRADSIRRELSAWEADTYRAYDSLARVMVRAARREPVVDSTRVDGWVTLQLPSGDWWVTAEAINVLDPNARWYWNVPVTGDTVNLSAATGRTRTRTR